jgi:hypothetical protein
MYRASIQKTYRFNLFLVVVLKEFFSKGNCETINVIALIIGRDISRPYTMLDPATLHLWVMDGFQKKRDFYQY